MEKSAKKRVFVGAVIAGSLLGIVATANVAAATEPGKEFINTLVKWSGGAVDNDGNPVESETLVTDELPSDLGEIQHEGTVTPTNDTGTTGELK
jgi:hypothetical protein